MKIRHGFVSNSSSSSFVIHKGFLSEEQICRIYNYKSEVDDYLVDNPIDYNDDVRPTYDFSYVDDFWNLKDFEDCVFGETSMDNFSFSDFFNFIGVNDNLICWDDGYNDEPNDSQEKFIKSESKRLRKMKLKHINKEDK